MGTAEFRGRNRVECDRKVKCYICGNETDNVPSGVVKHVKFFKKEKVSKGE